jgi:hypothetical protein
MLLDFGGSSAYNEREKCRSVETLEHIWRTVPAGYLSKPFFEDQLRLALERVLETRQRRLNPPERHHP